MGEENFEPFNFRGEITKDTFKTFLKYCSDRGASDILIQGGDYIWVEVSGRQLQASTTTIKQGQLPCLVSGVWGPEVESIIRGGTGADRSLELGENDVSMERGKVLRFRCNFIQARVARSDAAYAITMRVIPSDLPSIETMGIEKDLFESFYPGMGLVLVCGPTGSGKTTLQAGVYAYAGRHMPDRKVITYEDPIEFVLGGAHWRGPQPAQSQLGRDVASFALGLRNAMRRKPSIIGIGEMRDLETMDAAIEAGLTGHLCYATMHTESCAETISRAIQVYPSAQQGAVASRLLGALRVIVVQRLLKTVDGKRRAVREYVVFDRDLKNELQSVSYDHWAPMIRKRLESQDATLDARAWSLLRQGRISKAEFIELAGHKDFNVRQKREEEAA